MTTERLNNEALLPCPFCGEKPTVRLDDLINGRVVDDPIYYVECENTKCGVWPEASGPDRKYHSVIAAWNRRAAPADERRATPERALDEKILAELVRARAKLPRQERDTRRAG